MFWDNLEAACKANGIKVTPLLKELGISTGNIGRWQKGGSVTSDCVVTLAKRLNVTTDFLLTGEHKIEGSGDPLPDATQAEVDMVLMFRQLPAAQKEFIIDGIKQAYARTTQEGMSAKKA